MIATYACTHVESKAIADLPATRGWNEIFAHAKQLPGARHVGMFGEGEGDDSVWVCPLDETPVDACDAAPEEMDVAIAVDRFEKAVDWPVEAVERKWAGLRTFAPDRGMKFGFDPDAEGFFWCVGQGGMGIQTAPAASLLCASLILGRPLPDALAGIEPRDFSPRSIRSD